MKFQNIKIKLVLLFSFVLLPSCFSDISYLLHVSKGQIDLLSSAVPIEEALQTYNFSESERKKLQLVEEVKKFSAEKLEMDIDEDIYSSYVQLEEPYVTYLIRVAPAYELKAYKWDFPVIGKAPYKGFFDKEMAKEALRDFPKEEYDTYLRGVTAYSTLDWFEDPILSSMLSYEESDFVLLLFHELTHTVLFFKNHINFNERFAEFVARKAGIQFYLEKEGGGVKSNTIKKMKAEWKDELLFSSFMVEEYESLDKWYKENQGQINQEMKEKRLKEITTRFTLNIQPKLQTNRYNYFANRKLNNAKLLSYRSYNYNMDVLEKIFNSPLVNGNIKAFIEYCAQFEKEEDPEKALEQAINL